MRPPIRPAIRRPTRHRRRRRNIRWPIRRPRHPIRRWRRPTRRRTPTPATGATEMRRAGIGPQKATGMAPAEAALLASGLVLGAALLARGMGPGGSNRATKRWYRSLEKPGFTPPGTVIGSVWTVLDALMGIAG